VIRLIYYSFVILSIYSCSAKIGSNILSKQPPLPDTTFVLVLQQQDDFDNDDGIEVGSIKSSDNGLSKNCTFNEVIGNLKQLARQNGANLIKIIERKSPDRWSSCERIRAKIFRVSDFRKYEKEIEWTANRKLTWEDFKGVPKSFSNTNVAAQTYCGFGFQTNYVTLLTKTKIFVTTTFNCNLSWVRPDQKGRTDLLEHEQGHFDLCEVYARQLRKKLREKKMTVFNLNTDANIIFKDVYKSYLDRQELYEKETNYGLNRQKQIEWDNIIANELNELSEFLN
jgi:hypothetical protein